MAKISPAGRVNNPAETPPGDPAINAPPLATPVATPGNTPLPGGGSYHWDHDYASWIENPPYAPPSVSTVLE